MKSFKRLARRESRAHGVCVPPLASADGLAVGSGAASAATVEIGGVYKQLDLKTRMKS